MNKKEIFSTDEILLMLCKSVESILSRASNSEIRYSPIVQKINKTGLSPDLGCFVLFDGGFSGLVVTNFTAEAAVEIYQNYMINMGMPADELANKHTADDVGNVMAELMNQILGDFINKVRNQLQTSIMQNQPKMLTINKQVIVSIGATLDRPQMRKVTFFTKKHHIFYLEFAMDKTEFLQLESFVEEDNNPDSIINEINTQKASTSQENNIDEAANDDLLKELDI